VSRQVLIERSGRSNRRAARGVRRRRQVILRRLTRGIGLPVGLVVALSVGSVAAAGPSVRNGDITFMRQDQAGFWQT